MSFAQNSENKNTAATTMAEAYRNVQTSPLRRGKEDPWWVDLGPARGCFIQEKLKKILVDLKTENYVQMALVCPRGIGKSTEFFCLMSNPDITTKYLPVYIEYDQLANSALLDYPDFLLCIAGAIEKAMRKYGLPLDVRLLEVIGEWFSDVTKIDQKDVTLSSGIETAAKAEAGIPFFAKLVATINSRLKTENKHLEETRLKLKKVPEVLLDNVNLLLQDANAKLKKEAKELLIIVDCLDRFPPDMIAELLLGSNADLLKKLNTNIIYTPSIQLYHLANRQWESLQSRWKCEILPSPMIKDQQGQRNKPAMEIFRALIQKRIHQSLFAEPSLIDDFIELCGGDIRDLLRLLGSAIESSVPDPINQEAKEKAVSELKNQYKDEIPPEFYAELVKVYRNKNIPGGSEIIIDALFHRYIREYNGQQWYDVHPIIQLLDAFQEAKSKEIGDPVNEKKPLNDKDDEVKCPGSLEKLTVKGFKSIKNLDEFRLGNLNVIIGANGAGKSNFVQIFRMLMAMTQKNFSRFILERGGADNFLFNGPKITPKINMEFEFASRNGNTTGPNSYRFELTPTADEKFLIREERRYLTTGWGSYGNPSEESRLRDERNKKAHNRQCNGAGHLVYESISNWMIYHFHDTSASAPMCRSEIVEDNEKLRGNAANIAPFLLKLKNYEHDSYERVVNTIRLATPFFDDFRLDVEKLGEAEKVRLSWKQKGSDFPMQPYHLSDGSIRFICLATALLQPSPPSTIIIDEPELGLHPAALVVLAELIQAASKRTQVIVATQSPALIDQFGIEDIIVVNREDGASTFQRLKEADFSVWLEDYSVGELWSKNVIAGGPVYE